MKLLRLERFASRMDYDLRTHLSVLFFVCRNFEQLMQWVRRLRAASVSHPRLLKGSGPRVAGKLRVLRLQ